jgi:hypothetical protein
MSSHLQLRHVALCAHALRQHLPPLASQLLCLLQQLLHLAMKSSHLLLLRRNGTL